MTKAQLIVYINAWIKDNSNKEITAAIMRDVLDKIVQFIDDNVGEVQDLIEGETVIGAINMLFQMFEDLDVVHPVNKFEGTDNPNNVPPSGYNVGDLYVRNGNQLYQYNGSVWVRIVDSAGGIRSIVAGENVSIDNSDPLNPVINAAGGVQWNEITGDQSDIFLSGFTNDLPSSSLEVYSESGTLAGGDAVATIGDFDFMTQSGNGLQYLQNLAGGLTAISSKVVIIQSTSNSYPLELSSKTETITFSEDPNIGEKGAILDYKGTTSLVNLTVQNKSGTIALLPTAKGTAGQFLQTDGDDNVVWATPSGGGLTSLLPIETSNTNSTIALTTSGGNLCNMGSANTNTTYTTTGTVLNAYAKVLINATTEPMVTGATKIKGATFIASTNMYMVVNYNGVRVEYYFLEI